MKILGITSVTEDCGVALIEGEETLGHIAIPHGRGLSESLLPAIRSLFADIGDSLSSLDGIAVTAGPGSFTGIKVGLAAAKGLAYTLSCRIAAISTLEALAWRAGSRPGPEAIIPVINAGRSQIFAGCYHFVEGVIEQKLPDRLISLPELHALIQKPALLVGDAALQAYDLLADREGIVLEDSSQEREIPLPLAVARLGLLKIIAGGSTTAATLSPLYLQRHEAEVLMEKRLASAAGQSCSA